MRRSLWVLVGIIIGVAGTSFLFAPSVTGARAGNFTAARASGFIWENGAPIAPEGASDFCSAVYAGTDDEVSILMTLPDGAELVGAPIEDFFTIIETGDLISVKPCFDQDSTNDPQGRVLSIEEAQVLLLSQPDEVAPDEVVSDLSQPDEVVSDEVVSDDRDSGGCYLVTEADVASQVANEWLVPQRPGLDCNDEHIVGCAASGSCPVPPAAEVARVTPLYVAQLMQTLYAWIEQNTPGISLEEAAQLYPGICAPSWLEPQHLASAGVAIPGWLSSLIIGYGDGPDCN